MRFAVCPPRYRGEPPVREKRTARPRTESLRCRALSRRDYKVSRADRALAIAVIVASAALLIVIVWAALTLNGIFF